MNLNDNWLESLCRIPLTGNNPKICAEAITANDDRNEREKKREEEVNKQEIILKWCWNFPHHFLSNYKIHLWSEYASFQYVGKLSLHSAAYFYCMTSSDQKRVIFLNEKKMYVIIHILLVYMLRNLNTWLFWFASWTTLFVFEFK